MRHLLSSALALCVLTLASEAQVKNGSTWTGPGGVTVTVGVSVNPIANEATVTFSQPGGYTSAGVAGTPSSEGGKAVDDSAEATTMGTPTEGGAVPVGDTFRAKNGGMQVRVKNVWRKMNEKPKEEEKSSNGPGGGVGTLPVQGW